MNYRDGQPVLLGDRVDIGGGVTGVVVAVIDEGEFSNGYSADEWSYLSMGALVETPQAGLIHCVDASNDFDLIARKGL